jgi:hypothetical protein
VLVPSALVWLLVVGASQAFQGSSGISRQRMLAYLAIAIVVVFALLLLADAVARRKQDQEDEAQAAALRGPDTTGTFPVPSLEALLADRPLSPVAVTSGGGSEPRTIEGAGSTGSPTSPEETGRG